MNVIIIAALVLLVLIVIALIFGGRIQNFGQTTQSCTAQGGECKPECDPLLGEAQIGDSLTTDCPNVCCMKTR